jgi:hypothetical protein
VTNELYDCLLLGRRSYRSAAVISADGRYRYMLWRACSGDALDRSLENAVLFIGLNPSTADASNDDATVRRWIGFARAWGYSSFFAANLFAFRSTDPGTLKVCSDPVGPENDWWLTELALLARDVVCCWGNPGLGRRADSVLRELPRLGRDPKALRLSATRTPRPLRALREGIL